MIELKIATLTFITDVAAFFFQECCRQNETAQKVLELVLSLLRKFEIELAHSHSSITNFLTSYILCIINGDEKKNKLPI